MKINKISYLSCSFGLLFCFLVNSTVYAKSFRIALGDGEGGTQHALVVKFSEVLAEKTDGKAETVLFFNGQLGSEQDTVNDASMGILDFSILTIANATPFSPTIGLLTLPYVIQSIDEAVILTQGEIGKELIDNTIRDAGVRIVGWAYSGFRVLTNSKRAVKSLADLKGLVIRVPKNAIMIDTFKSWGINPTPMAWSETFTALQQGVVDGQDNTYITINVMKFNEVQEYATNLRYIFSIEPLIVSESVFQAQSPEMQKAILDSGKAATEFSVEYLRKTESTIRKTLVDAGMRIDDPADGEREWIAKATTAVWPKYYDSIGGKVKLDNALKAVGR